MQASAADYALTYLTTQNWQLVIGTVAGLTTAKHKTVMLSMHGSSLSNCMHILL
jgi:hypothetical protein